MQAAIEAVAEVGNPTVVATLTVIAALLPMLFVSGLMGPYMAPIPANASAAMLFSFFVAMVVAPWLMLQAGAARPRPRVAPGIDARPKAGSGASTAPSPPAAAIAHARLDLPARRSASPRSPPASLFYTENVTVKLLPFDNKSELAVVLNLPEGSSLEDTERTLFAAAEIARGLPEVALDAGLCRHRGAVQLQRPGAALLHAPVARTGRPAAQPGADKAERGPQQPRHRARSAAAACRAAAAARAARCRSSRCRPGRRCWRRCWPRSTVRTRRRAAPWRTR